MLSLLKRFRSVEEPAIPVETSTETVGLTNLDDAEKVSDAFPQLRHLAVNLSIRAADNEIEPSLNNRSFGPQSRAYFNFRCKNTECVKGGFDLREEIANAIESKRTDVTGRRVCHGWRDASNVGHRKCYFELNFKMHLSYNE